MPSCLCACGQESMHSSGLRRSWMTSPAMRQHQVWLGDLQRCRVHPMQLERGIVSMYLFSLSIRTLPFYSSQLRYSDKAAFAIDLR